MPETGVEAYPDNPLTGTSSTGTGVTGSSNSGAGVEGNSVGPPHLGGVASSASSAPAGDGVLGTGANGVHGLANFASGVGVLGENSWTGVGVRGTSVGGDGVYGASATGFGLHGRNTSPAHGSAPATPPASAASAVNASQCGVFAESIVHEGVFGTSSLQHGVRGVAAQNSGFTPAHVCGVWGESSAGYGVCATSNSTNGLWASSNADHGIHGETNSQSHAGVYGQNSSSFPCFAILGSSQNGHGVQGVNGAGSGTTPPYGVGVWGDSDSGIGVYGASKSGAAGQFDGNVTVSGSLTTGDVVLTAGGDCAERFDLSATATAEPGTVMVIDEDGALRPSDRAYDRRVAGVVSGAGEFRPGMVLDQRAGDDDRATIALVGKVCCKVDADAAPISVGDLLTTSAIDGHAMKATDPMQAFGSVVGKALSPLTRGRGLIPILVALQ